MLINNTKTNNQLTFQTISFLSILLGSYCNSSFFNVQLLHLNIILFF